MDLMVCCVHGMHMIVSCVCAHECDGVCVDVVMCCVCIRGYDRVV